MRALTLLTDFGTTDYYVGAVKGTVLRLAGPAVQLVDLSHDLPPGDVEGAAGLLAAAAPTFPEGTVHLAVVDPGVGSARRILAARAGGHLFVAPDNGLLTPFLAPAFPDETRGASGPVEVRHVTRDELFLGGPGATFHGRDQFAPVAAALARGEPLSALGPVIDDPVLLTLPHPTREPAEDKQGGHRLRGRVVRVDRFGNLVTDLPAAWVGPPETLRGPHGPRVEVGEHATDLWVAHYAELPDGAAGALIGSLGTVELSLDGRSLAALWGAARGAVVRIRTGPTSPPG